MFEATKRLWSKYVPKPTPDLITIFDAPFVPEKVVEFPAPPVETGGITLEALSARMDKMELDAKKSQKFIEGFMNHILRSFYPNFRSIGG